MINPNKLHRSRAKIIEISVNSRAFKVQLVRNGQQHSSIVEGFDLPKTFNIGEVVNIQAKFSIMLDQYVIKTVRKVRAA